MINIARLTAISKSGPTRSRHIKNLGLAAECAVKLLVTAGDEETLLSIIEAADVSLSRPIQREEVVESKSESQPEGGAL